ncbi:NosD domain-containing protein [Methanobacterium alcaliphilum]|uniref:NosD domain-containing protein n=1 Tax=Methanobacterium alcaliphilum TaxID=392018 RepID=UPI00200B35E2|nr:right-handed parallel beta-helix repeat-containing protein [Methanobacterium alcaliphilum]MCK9150565.1 right-handed parallel beta-helix repeat-containing protein [Methanobacterium alcaliphilum]
MGLRLYPDDLWFDTENNWWGTNNAIIDWEYYDPSKYYDIFYFGSLDPFYYNEVFYKARLVLDTNIEDMENNNYIITADLTHNTRGEDTSPWGHIPDGIPVYFFTDLGTITNISYTNNGKATAVLNSLVNRYGMANITISLDSQYMHTCIDVKPVVFINYPSGSYNVSSLNVTLQTVNNLDCLVYSFDNGTTWYNSTGNVTWSLYEDNWDILYYSIDSEGYNSPIQNVSYVIDGTGPYVWADNGTGLYDQSVLVNLTVTDNVDTNPVIYYTLDGSTPTNLSTIYTGSLNIINSTTLKFVGIDNFGNIGLISTEYYIFSPIGNLNTGKGYSNIQAAIDDPLTLNSHVIMVDTGNYSENIVVNKNLTIESVYGSNVIVQALTSALPVFKILLNGSGSTIQGFNIKGSSVGGIQLDYANYCNIIGNNITNNENGIYLENSYNNKILSNRIVNNRFGVNFFLSDSNVIMGNIISVNSDSGVYFTYARYNTVSLNNITNNKYGVHSYVAYNNTIFENNIAYNGYDGIYLEEHSSALIHFNRICGNGWYGLNINNATVNATNNWWGSNYLTNKDIHIINGGSVDYNTWIILTLSPTSYKISDGKVSEAVITITLNYNSDGRDVSYDGCLPDYTPIFFSADNGSIISSSFTKNGKASTTLSLDQNFQSEWVNVTLSLDDQEISTRIDRAAKAIITVLSSAIDLSTNQTLYLNYELPLNESVSWVSVIWKQPSNLNGTHMFTINGTTSENIIGRFQNEINIIINGNVVLNRTVCNSNYLQYKTIYSQKVFDALHFINYLFSNSSGSQPSLILFIKNNIDQTISENIPYTELTENIWEDKILSAYKRLDNLTDNDIAFIKNNRHSFQDILIVDLNYMGSTEDVQIRYDNKTLYFNEWGNDVLRVSKMIC